MAFSKLKFKNKLLFTFLSVFIPLLLMGSTLAYYQFEKILQAQIEKELQATTDSLLNLIKTSASVSIKNRLHAIAEKNLDIVRYYYDKYRSGLLGESELTQIIEEIFLSQSVGLSGYVYCLNSKGRILIHPDDNVRGTDASQLDFIRQQMEIKDGYLEYGMENPDKSGKRAKALYMLYFKPLDWIISAASYREEFNHLVNIDDFRDNILSYKSGKTGYVFVLDENGTAVVHPKVKGINLLRQTEYPNEFLKQILKEKNGKIRYSWKNPDEPAPREKIVVFKYLPEYKWIVGSSSYVDEIFSPLNTLRMFLIVVLVVVLLSSVGITYLICSFVTKPLALLMDKFEQGAGGDFSVRMEDGVPDEFGKLSRYFNFFMGRLEQNHKRIESEIRKNMEVQAAFEENDLKLRSLFDQSFQYNGIISPLGLLERVNQSSLDSVGCTAEDVEGKPFWQTPWWRHDTEVQQQVKEAVEKAGQGDFVRFESSNIAKDNQIRNVDITIKPVFNPLGEVVFMIVEGRDITQYKQAARERKNLAVQLEKAQKMEAIGTLAGGIAHDFNNILSGIIGYSQLAEMSLDSPVKAREHIEKIACGAHRAARLTQQILTFSRQAEYEKHPLNLYLLLKEALKLLRSSIPSTIEISENIVSKEKVLSDPGQMHQVIMNLCINAYHAMEKTGGILTVKLQEVKISEDKDIFGHAMNTGKYLELEITDTGVGMAEEVLMKAFDPYFTTKEVGKGTGVGLAVVHAIVDAHDGYIKVRSSVGQGTSFYVYLPLVEPAENFYISGKGDKSMKGGTEKIMVVDDEEDIRLIVQRFLTICGYSVDTFENGLKAFETFEKDPNQFDLIITDMTMPQMTGDEFSRKVFEIREDIPVILFTGYSETVSEEQALGMGIRKYVQKPFSYQGLAASIREILDQAG